MSLAIDDDDDDMLLAAALSKEVDAVHECLWLLMSRFDEEDHEKHSEIGTTSNSSEQQQQGNTDNNEYIVTRRMNDSEVRGVNSSFLVLTRGSSHLHVDPLHYLHVIHSLYMHIQKGL